VPAVAIENEAEQIGKILGTSLTVSVRVS